MFQVTLQLKNQNSVITETAKKHSTIIKSVECNHGFSLKGCSRLIELVDVEEEKVDEIVKDFKENTSITSVELGPSKKGFATAIIKTNQCGNCEVLHFSDIFLVSQMADENGVEEWKVISPDEKEVLSLIERLKEKNIDIQIVSKVKMTNETMLTARQEKIMQIAYKRGYFDYPKRINIRKLADIFDVSISTMSEILRKGEKKIIGSYFKDA